jgi:hypothetical protein
MTQLDNRYDALAWGSHLVPLMACVCETMGPVLEIGIGHFSTPVLHAVCEAMGRDLVSVEQNEEWYEEFKSYSNKSHRVILTKDYDSNDIICDPWAWWSVSFIDNSPGGERRKNDFKRLIENSDYVVVHDYELENLEAIHPILESSTDIKWAIYNRYKPPTLVASKRKLITNGCFQ